MLVIRFVFQRCTKRRAYTMLQVGLEEIRRGFAIVLVFDQGPRISIIAVEKFVHSSRFRCIDSSDIPIAP